MDQADLGVLSSSFRRFAYGFLEYGKFRSSGGIARMLGNVRKY